MPKLGDATQKVVGLNPGASKGFFLRKSLIKCTSIVIWNMYHAGVSCLLCMCGRCTQNLNIKFKEVFVDPYNSVIQCAAVKKCCFEMRVAPHW